MKTCPQCNASLGDDAVFCTNCGTPLNAAPQPEQQIQTYQPQPEQQAMPVTPVVNQFDHTAEFSEEEVHDNKIFALAIYALSFIGIIIALLAKSSDNSAYLRFHIKQMLMILITEILVGVAAAVLSWTCIGLIAGCGLLAFLGVVEIICFINVCRNKSIEPLLVRKLTFLK